MKTKQLLLCSLFCALNVIFAQIIVPTAPVQFSLSIIPVMLSGLIFLPEYAFLTQIAYLILGIAGLPVLGKFSGGIGILFGPTGGYILSYPLMALLCAFILKFFKNKNFLTYFFSQLPALAVCYASGSMYLAFITKVSFYQALLIGVAPFIIFDIIKIAVCALLANIIKKKLRRVI